MNFFVRGSDYGLSSMTRLTIPSLVVCIALLSGCVSQVQDDYPQYLANNVGQVEFPQVTETADYYLDRQTQNYSTEIKAFMTGIANSWVVQFGSILDATLQSEDVRNAIGTLKKIDKPAAADDLLLTFELKVFRFEDFHTTVIMDITAQDEDRVVLSDSYQAEGISQGGKMLWGGALAMKNAVQQSTKSALDQILLEFFADLKQGLVVETSRSRDAPVAPADPGDLLSGFAAKIASSLG